MLVSGQYRLIIIQDHIGIKDLLRLSLNNLLLIIFKNTSYSKVLLYILNVIM